MTSFPVAASASGPVAASVVSPSAVPASSALPAGRRRRRVFRVILIKPVRYDDDGYPIQWWRAVYPSFSLTLLHALVEDCGQRQVLGPETEIVVEAYDDQCGLPPISTLIARLAAAPAGGVLAIVGVHTAQFPRGAAIARAARAAGVPVIIGGSHVSGCLGVMPTPPPELQEMLDLGASLFAGEAEGRLDAVLQDAAAKRMPPIYDYGGQPVDLATAPLPVRLPPLVERGLALRLDPISPVEAGRGCPYTCTFCTVVNVHGRTPRARPPERVACFVRASVARGRTRFLFTDDNFARNQNWRPILEALIDLREQEGLRFTFILQCDTQADRIPDFFDLAARAGCVQVFVGLENINPAALRAVGKSQNVVARYRAFFQAWKRRGVVTMAGYIVGFPNDTPDSILADVETLKRELPVDLLYFFILTPLPGSADHAALVRQGAPLDADASRYTTFHATTPHPRMSRDALETVFRACWARFYDDAHCARVMRRHLALGGALEDLTPFQWVARCAFAIENVNPAEFGLGRRQVRRDRRPDLPREALVPFWLRQGRRHLRSVVGWWADWRRLRRIERTVRNDPAPPASGDPALADGGADERVGEANRASALSPTPAAPGADPLSSSVSVPS